MEKVEDDTRLILERISLEEFTKIVDATKTEAVSREMAQMVLVNGMQGVYVADLFKVPKQRVGLAVERVRCKHRTSFREFGLCKTPVPVPAAIIDSLDGFGQAYLKMSPDTRVDAVTRINELLSELSKGQLN